MGMCSPEDDNRLIRDAVLVGASLAAVLMLDEAGLGRLADLALHVEKTFANDATLTLERCRHCC